MPRFVVAFALATVVCGSITASAQARHPVALEGGGLFSSQRSLEPVSPDPAIPRPGVGGSAFGWIAGAAVDVAPSVDVGIEIGDTASFESTQTTNYESPAPIVNRHHELIVSPLVRFHQRPRYAFRVEEVAGAAVVREDTTVQVAELIGWPIPQIGPFFAEPEITRVSLGLTGGLNVAVVLNRHISLVPEARLYWISRADPNSGTEPSGSLGLDPLVLRLAVVLRATL